MFSFPGEGQLSLRGVYRMGDICYGYTWMSHDLPPAEEEIFFHARKKCNKKSPCPSQNIAGTRAIHFYNTPAVPPGLTRRRRAHSCILTYACFDNGVKSPACLLMPYIQDCRNLCHICLMPCTMRSQPVQPVFSARPQKSIPLYSDMPQSHRLRLSGKHP